MAKRKKIVAISGSTRQNSTNLNLLKAIEILFEDTIEMKIFEGIATLPHFNPDDTDKAIPEVMLFREKLRHADAVIICTPEYAHGVPGSLKNAIDWTVSTNEFSHKPTALITASTDGRAGHAALLETLQTIEAENVAQLQLLIQFASTKIGKDYIIKDEATLTAIKELITALLSTIATSSIAEN
jgi:chromate reductase, NAD(P)H dehydrogenase (quinone)